MNSLSWLIYLSSVCESLKVAAGIGLFFLVTAAVPLMAVKLDGYPKRWVWSPRLHFGGCLFLTMVCIFAPDSGTLRLIAASEFGERVIQSQQVQGVVDPGLKYVQKWLNDKLTEKEK